MEWWNNLVDWFYSNDGRYVVTGIVMPAVAIIIAAILGATIAAGAVKRLLAKHDHYQRVAVIASLVDAAEQAAVWNSLTPQEQVLSDRAVGQADIQLRLLPIKGSSLAADWAAHSLGLMKRNSATFGYQVEPAVIEFRDRLLEWQERPGKSRRILQADIERWQLEDEGSERQLLRQQDDWVAQQHHEQFSRPAVVQAPNASAPESASPAASASAPIQPGEQSVGASTEVTTSETRRVLENVNAVEQHLAASHEASTPPPVNAFPPRRGKDKD